MSDRITQPHDVVSYFQGVSLLLLFSLPALSLDCLMSNRAGYQPLPQIIDEEDDVGEGGEAGHVNLPTATRGLRRTGRPRSIDLTKLDNAFKR